MTTIKVLWVGEVAELPCIPCSKNRRSLNRFGSARWDYFASQLCFSHACIAAQWDFHLSVRGFLLGIAHAWDFLHMHNGRSDTAM